MKEKILAVVLSVCLLFTALPYMTDAVMAQAAGHSHSGWTAWSTASALPGSAGNYYLTADVNLSGTWSVPGGTTNLCLNGHTIKQNGGVRVITVPSNAVLNLYDENNAGKITGGSAEKGGGISVQGTFTMNGGQVTGNRTTSNLANQGGAGIAVEGGTFTMNGGSICNNASAFHGGGIVVDGNGNAFMTGGTITGNTAGGTSNSKHSGGGVHIYPRSVFTMSGGEISNNTAPNSGGGVNVDGTFTMNGGTITGNTAESVKDGEGGGGIGDFGTVILNGGTISGNTASHGGGVLYSQWSTSTGLKLSGNFVISGNRNTGGGADNLYLEDGKYITINGGLTSGAQIGVKTETQPSSGSPVNLTTTCSTDYSGYFVSDVDGYAIEYKNNKLCLVKPSHVYTYTANGAVITRTCSTHSSEQATATLSINSSANLTYTGSEIKPVAVTCSSGWDENIPEVTYENNINVGTATASITVHGVTASLRFTIQSAEMGTVTASGYSGAYDGNSHGITVSAPSGTTVKYGTKAGSYTENTSPVYKAVGTYTVYYQVTKPNYTAKTGSATIRITTPNTGVTLNGNGGSGTKLTSYTFGTGATLPTDWKKAGYTFAGWYDNENLSGTPVTKILTTDFGNKEYWAKWTANTYTVKYNGNRSTGGSTASSSHTYGTEKKLTSNGYKREYTVTFNHNYTESSNTTKTASYTFSGWNTNADGTGTSYTNGQSVKNLTQAQNGTVTLYAKWTSASVTYKPARTGYAFAGWFTDSDCSGTRVDTDGAYTPTANMTLYAKWTDQTAPVIGTLTYNYVPNNLWQWLIGKESLIITVPVTEEGSGADEITYIVTPDGGTAVTKTVPIKKGKAEITVSADFKGTIVITCTDKAGNTSAGVTVGTNGIIIEDHAPEITFAVNGNPVSQEKYEKSPAVTVTVTDDKDNALSGGIASVRYTIGDGSEKTVSHNYTADMVVNDSFTIPANEIPMGDTVITVTAEDNAGNTAAATQTVRVKTGLDKAAEAEAVVENALSGIPATNDTTQHAVQEIINEALKEAGITDVTAAITEFNKTKEATTDEGGKFTVTISFTSNSETESKTYEIQIPATGVVDTKVETKENAPETCLSTTKEEMEEKLLDQEDKQQMENGKDITIVLKVEDAKDSVTDTDKGLVEEKLKDDKAAANGFSVGQYLDVSLIKEITDKGSSQTETKAITETAIMITITITVPENLKNTGRTFAVIRVHDGVAEVLEDKDKDPNTITIETDRFSTYGIVYRDAPSSGSGGSEPSVAPPSAPDDETKPDESDQTGNEIEERTDVSILLASGKQKGKNAIRLTWLKCSGATGYEVYWSYCDGKKNFKKVKTVKADEKRTCTHSRLKKDRAYKYFVAAYKIEDGKKHYTAKSPTIHVAMKNEKRTNVKSIKLNKTKITLKKGKTFRIQSALTLEDKEKKPLSHAPKLRYYTDNKKIATVSKNGKITAKGKGTCIIYVIANNGVYEKIKVTVE